MSLLNSGGLGSFATRPSYSLGEFRVGVKHPNTECRLNVRNLTNAKPNLGDSATTVTRSTTRKGASFLKSRRFNP